MAYFLLTLHVGQQVCLQFYSMYIFLFIFWDLDWKNSLCVEHSVLIGNEKEQDCWQKYPVVCVASVYTSLAKANHMTKPDSGSGKYTSLSRGHCKSQGNEQGHIILLQISREQLRRNIIYQSYPLRLNILESLKKKRKEKPLSSLLLTPSQLQTLF